MNCVYQNEGWSMQPRDDPPGYFANYLGLVQCFTQCTDVDIIVWNEGTQYCQCWDVKEGYSYYTGPAVGDTTFILAFCDEPASGDAKSLAIDTPET
eukprot:scaffold665021_cov59-Prasinocladus_malaysianus.AAC.1